MGRIGIALVVMACGAPTVHSPPPPPPPAAPVPITRPPAPACASAITGKPSPVIDAAGNTLAVVPVDTWFTTAIAWAGEDLVMVRRLSEIGYGQQIQNAIERWAPADASAPKLRTLHATDSRVLATTADGKRMVIAHATAIALHDAATGALESQFAVTAASSLATAGVGEELVVLAGGGANATLYDRFGGVLEQYKLDGTTPTIMRVYGRDPDHPTHHDNILKQSPSWVAALAVSRDRKRVAIGGSDSKVRLYEQPTRGKPRVLEYKWKYTEHRHMGGNPDLNAPLAMRFSDDGKELVVVYAHGEVIAWSTATGAPVRRLDAGCATTEATALVNRYRDPSEPPIVPKPADLASCGGATRAVIAPDGTWYASNIGMMRIRALPSGAPIAMIPEIILDDMLAISPGGKLAMVDIYGSATLWSASAKTTVFLPAPITTGPLTPRLSASGRVLAFEHGKSLAAWDPTTGKRFTSPDRILAISDDGTRFVVQTARGRELRDGDPANAGKLLGVPDGRLELADTGKVLVDVIGHDEILVRDLERGTDARIKTASAVRTVVRADGRQLATFGAQAPLQIWDTRTGRALATFETGVRAVALFPDGKRIAYVIQDKRAGTAKIRELGGKVVAELTLDGWINDVTVAPDGSEVVFALENAVTRYAPATRVRRDTPTLGHALRVHYGPDGDTLVFEQYNQVSIRRTDDDLTLVARVYPLTSGGYLVMSEAGAVAGSVDARDSIVTRATGKAGTTVLAGAATWDRWHRADTYACALTGEIAGPTP